MPIYDRLCDNGHREDDLYEPITYADPPCKSCGAATKRTRFPGHRGGVIQDSIEGGVWIRHGLCHEDGTPRKFYSHTEIREAAKAKGLTNIVEHVPGRDGDKSKHTVRWVGISTITEEERLKHWYADEESRKQTESH